MSLGCRALSWQSAMLPGIRLRSPEALQPSLIQRGIQALVDWLKGSVQSMRLSVTPSEKILIDLIRSHEEVTKAELVSYTDYSRSKINTCVDSLLKKKFIKNNGSNVFTGGRRPKMLTLNGSFGLV